MDKRLEELLLRWGIRVFVLLFIVILLLYFLVSITIPGLISAIFFLIWIMQWRLFYIRGMFPGKIYTFIYLLVSVLACITAIQKILS